MPDHPADDRGGPSTPCGSASGDLADTLAIVLPACEVPGPSYPAGIILPDLALGDGLSSRAAGDTGKPARRKVKPWLRLVSMGDPIPAEKTAAAIRCEPKTIKRHPRQVRRRS